LRQTAGLNSAFLIRYNASRCIKTAQWEKQKNSLLIGREFLSIFNCALSVFYIFSIFVRSLMS